MSRISRLMLRFPDWPVEDQSRWEAAFKTGDRFDEWAPVPTSQPQP